MESVENLVKLNYLDEVDDSKLIEELSEVAKTIFIPLLLSTIFSGTLIYGLLFTDTSEQTLDGLKNLNLFEGVIGASVVLLTINVIYNLSKLIYHVFKKHVYKGDDKKVDRKIGSVLLNGQLAIFGILGLLCLDNLRYLFFQILPMGLLCYFESGLEEESDELQGALFLVRIALMMCTLGPNLGALVGLTIFNLILLVLKEYSLIKVSEESSHKLKRAIIVGFYSCAIIGTMLASPDGALLLANSTSLFSGLKQYVSIIGFATLGKKIGGYIKSGEKAVNEIK